MSDKPHPALLRAARATIDANTSGTIEYMVDTDARILDTELHYTELVEALRLIDAEWQSDPMSVQCFDLRIVHTAHALLAKIDGGDHA